MFSVETEIGQRLERRRGSLAAAVVERCYARDPSMAERYGPAGRAKCEQDSGYHLAYLAEALIAGSATLFADYVRWAAAVLVSRSIPTSDLALHLRALRDVLGESLDAPGAHAARTYLDAGLHALGSTQAGTPEEADYDAGLRALALEYLGRLLEGDAVRARLLVLNAAEEGTSVRDLYVHVLQWTQHEIGRRWQANQITVAQEHLATAVTRQVMGGLTALAAPAERAGRTAIITCVATEQHEVGARMVADFFEMEGWRTYYLGADLPTAEVLESVKRYRADVLGLSATLTPHLKLVREIITALRSNPETASVRVIVGGYPFNVDPDIWQQLGADGCASSAETAVRIAETLMDGARD